MNEPAILDPSTIFRRLARGPDDRGNTAGSMTGRPDPDPTERF
jgi:hypothetical protein